MDLAEKTWSIRPEPLASLSRQAMSTDVILDLEHPFKKPVTYVGAYDDFGNFEVMEVADPVRYIDSRVVVVRRCVTMVFRRGYHVSAPLDLSPGTLLFDVEIEADHLVPASPDPDVGMALWFGMLCGATIAFTVAVIVVILTKVVHL